ncbi:DMT family transporter [Propioniciclava coleopterorum]|uniref:DMT family transporter n=1 Tax=Propioniciclava coleopterorum TaxID=2714937 RepID=A0A6G7Y3V9_9ACTN|nr:DMT family transporter [Propioniciclava coleopterorum]QIK71389.1 DMT family transporter [Propioniciclava coleopterorum]
MSARTRSHLLLLACAAIWGLAFVAQRLGAEAVGASTFIAARNYLGAAALLPLLWFLDRREGRDAAARREAWRAVVVPGLVIGALLFAGSELQQVGIEHTTAGNAAFVTGLYMVMVPLAGRLFGHRTPPVTWLGIALAVPGLFLLTWTGSGIGLGDLLCLIGAGVWTFHILAVGRAASALDPIRLSVAQFVVAAVLATGAAPLFEERPFVGMEHALGAIAFAGLVSTGVGYTLQVVGMRHARASVAAMIMALEAVFGALGGALFLGERLSARGLLGAALMMAGILVAQVPSRAERARERAAELAGQVPPPVPEPPSTALREG